jgi:lysocardiolipin and lysophospholipid acyltransferase
MKEEIGRIPIVGAAVKSVEFLLLKRNWETDSSLITNQIKTFAQGGFPFFLMLFPEGTLMHTEGKEKCRFLILLYSSSFELQKKLNL